MRRCHRQRGQRSDPAGHRCLHSAGHHSDGNRHFNFSTPDQSQANERAGDSGAHTNDKIGDTILLHSLQERGAGAESDGSHENSHTGHLDAGRNFGAEVTEYQAYQENRGCAEADSADFNAAENVAEKGNGEDHEYRGCRFFEN